MSTKKPMVIEGKKDFTSATFNGERDRWEDYERAVKMLIKRHPDISAEWNGYLFTAYPSTAERDDFRYTFPVEFIRRALPEEPAAIASDTARRTRHDYIKREMDFNARVSKSLSIHTGILSDTISDSLMEIFADRFEMEPYNFYRYLRRTYGPESNANEDRSSCMHKLLKLKMNHLDAFDTFLVSFKSKCDYLSLNDHAKRGLITATLQNTDGRVQLLCDRLVPELKHVREEDLDYNNTIAWLKRQDIRQANDGLPKVSAIKKVGTVEVDVLESDRDSRFQHKKIEKKLVDGNGLTMRPFVVCYNCSNYGHGANDCLSSFCSKCASMNPDHTWSNCKAKGDRKRKGKREKPNKNDSSFKRRGSEISKKANKKVKQVTYEEDASDGESLRDDAASGYGSEMDAEDFFEEDDIIVQPRKILKRHRTRVLKIRHPDSWIRKIRKPIKALIDSGAQIHAARTKDLLSKVVSEYQHDNNSNIQLSGASGEDLNASATGFIDGLKTEVIIADIDDDIIVSTSQLSKSNLWTCHPPTGLIPGVGVVVFEHNESGDCGKIVMVGNNEMYSNPDHWYSYNTTVNIPQWKGLSSLIMGKTQFSKTHVGKNNPTRIDTSKKLYRIIGMERFNVSQRVLFQQRTYFASIDLMIWYAKNIPTFPLSESQIQQYYIHDETGRTRGIMEKRRHQTRGDVDQSEMKEINEYFKSLEKPVVHKAPEVNGRQQTRNTVIGYETGSDIAIGPGNVKAVFVDKASGFKWSLTMKSKDQLPDALIEYCDLMESYGHKLQHFRSDDEAIYKTPTMKAIFKRYGISATQSAPDLHQWNGLAESSNKRSKALVTSMLACAKHLTESFWTKAWELSDLIHSLGPCNIRGKEGMTKFQAVKGFVPDLNNIVILPFGQPVEFHVPKAERGMFHEKSRAGSYVGASLTHPASIQVWSHNTRKIITTASFKVKHVIADPDKVFDRSVFRDEDDCDDSVISDIRRPESIPGSITRKRSFDLERGMSQDMVSHDELSDVSTAGSDVLFQEGETTHTATPMSRTVVLQEGDTLPQSRTVVPQEGVPPPVHSTRSYAEVLQEGVHSTNDLSTGSLITMGPITRSRSQVITTVTSLRTSDRLKNNTTQYNEQTITNDNHEYRSLCNAHRINGKPSDKVALAQSLLKNAGHGLFATKFIKEGTHPCTYGKHYATDSRFMAVYDTVYEDKNGVAIGNRNKDYGCWCNDPLDDSKINCVVEYDFKNRMYKLRARWDIAPGEEMYVGYGESFWRYSYWTCPELVKARYPNITPHRPAPAEGDLDNYVELPQDAPDEFPIDIFETKTRLWTQPKKRVRIDQGKRIGNKAMRIARVLSSTFAINQLMIPKTEEDLISDVELIERRIRKINQEVEVRTVGDRRVSIRTKAQIESLKMMQQQLKKIKKTQSKRGIRHDNPTLTEAKKREDWPLFQKAIEVELRQIAVEEKAHEDKPTARSSIPKDANVIGSMLVLTVKRLPNGKIDKYKARLVALGNHQKESSYEQIKSGTVRGSTVKMLVALQAKTQAQSMVLDIKGAYLKYVIQAPEKEKLYLRYPDGRIFKLLKYIYGLKQAGYEWQQNITGVLIQLGYKQSHQDPLVFIRHFQKKWIVMCVHVDDFFVVSSEKSMLTELYDSLTKEYGSVSINKGDLLSYLGMQISVDKNNGKIKLSQPGYAKQLCDKFLTGNKIIVHTPMAVCPNISELDDQPCDITEYLRAVGGINYLAIHTRPDILYSLSMTASACASPTMGDWKRVMRIIGYISCTLDYGLTFLPGPIKLQCMVDSSFNLYHDGKCHYGYSFTLGIGDAAFFSVSRRMKVQPLSSTEAEYVAFCEACRDAIYLKRLLAGIGFPCEGAIEIFEDNMSCIDMLNGKSRHTASKHINPKFHFGRDMVMRGVVNVSHISTNSMVADIFTKPLGRGAFELLTRDLLNC